jgi:diguanylate cyclase (GGDEF)-like protein
MSMTTAQNQDQDAVGAFTAYVRSCRQMRLLQDQVTDLGWGIANDPAKARLVLADMTDGDLGISQLVSLTHGFRKSVVVIYGEDQAESLPHLARLGARHFLKHPFAPSELAAVLLAVTGPVVQDRRRFQRDAMTGLPLADDLRTWLANSSENGPLTLCLINIKRFDAVNTSLGRDAGDALLKACARRIEPIVSELRDCDKIVARLPGAEFAVGLSGAIPHDRIYILAEAIADSLSRPMPTRHGPLTLGAHLVVVDAPDGDRAGGDLLRRASRLLGDLRESDGGPVLLAIGDAGEAESLARSLHADLRAALAKDEIDILFQPQVSVTSGRIEGVEALARWQHPVRGELGAATLFAVADQSNYLLELSAHIQRRALKLAAGWPEKLSHLRLALNVTASDLDRPRFFKTLQNLVEESGFPRERLTLELTESSLMHDVPRTAKLLGHLRNYGVRVAIDDFGTGYSSLAWLKNLPADYLKLDQGLSSDIMGSDRDAVVLRGVISMARSLGLTVIAEGVETRGQLDLLAREGCALYQGYLFAPAVDVAGLADLVAG